MAGETIDLHRRIGMAGLTELSFGINRDKLTAGILAGMAVDAPDETVLDGTDALMHRLISIVFHKIEMITTHDIYRLNALLPAGRRNLGLHHITVHRRGRRQGNSA